MHGEGRVTISKIEQDGRGSKLSNLRQTHFSNDRKYRFLFLNRQRVNKKNWKYKRKE